MNGKLNRRDLLKASLLGGVGGAIALEQLGGVPLLGTWFSNTILNPAHLHFDAYHMIGEVLRGGAAALSVHKAMAQAKNDWSIVHIKVCNHVYIPLVFAIGRLEGDSVVRDMTRFRATSALGGKAGQILTAADQISDKPRYQALRMNRWFADMLHAGTSDGQAPAADGSNLRGFTNQDIGEFPAETEVALQTFLNLAQVGKNNHALKGCKLKANLPDLTLFLQRQGVIESPLGISCLMMGSAYDKAEGSVSRNAVLDAAGETEVISSRTATEYLGQIRQYVDAPSYADRASIEQNVIYRLDQLVIKEPKLRRELLNSVQAFKSGLGTLQRAAELESTRQASDPAQGNLQSKRGSSTGVGASSEFLGQCKFVTEVLKLPGQPLRNFSLFLNITDLDGRPLDNATLNGGDDIAGLDIQSYNYIEGMRQLAMGLNHLAQAIKSGMKMVVVVTSEGGRNLALRDSTTSFAMVMAPGGAGGLKDKLYANRAEIDKETAGTNADNFLTLPFDTGGLKEGDGSNSSATVRPTSGDVQMGVVEFLEEVTGRSGARNGLTGADARYVKLERA